MTIKEAKQNILNNFRSNYTNDHMSSHDVEVFLLNAMEQLETIVKENIKNDIAHKISRYEGRNGCENTKFEIITFIKNYK